MAEVGGEVLEQGIIRNNKAEKVPKLDVGGEERFVWFPLVIIFFGDVHTYCNFVQYSTKSGWTS
jgi:hypothetical protein